MSDPEIFDLQRLVDTGDLAGQWRTVASSLSYIGAHEMRQRFLDLGDTDRLRIQPFGTGPLPVEPGDDAPDQERQAWATICEAVKVDGGNVDDIYRHGQSFRWRAPHDHSARPYQVITLGW